MRILSCLAGLACLVCFLLPILAGRIVNIGNVTGICLGIFLFLYGMGRPRIHAAVRAAWRMGALPRLFLCAAGFLAVLIAGTAAVLTFLMVRAAAAKPAEDADVIVLGCQVRGDRPSRMLVGRMEAAISYLQDHPAARCVVSGGKGEDEAISEAACMYRYMTAHGIDPARILQEDRSTSTRENILFSTQLLARADHALGHGGRARPLAIVTDGFHACRARRIARALGFSSGTVPAKTPGWLLPTFYVRELYGLLYQILCPA